MLESRRRLWPDDYRRRIHLRAFPGRNQGYRALVVRGSRIGMEMTMQFRRGRQGESKDEG